MDPDIHVERLAMLSLEDKATEDNKEKKDDKDKTEDKQKTPKWRRIPRTVSEDKDTHEQPGAHEAEEEGKRERTWKDLGKYSPHHVEASGKWPRWRKWNPNKGPYHRESKETEEDAQEDMPKLDNKEHASSSSTSSSTTLTFWDADGIWHEYGGDWWKRREDGWWEKWQKPSQ